LAPGGRHLVATSGALRPRIVMILTAAIAAGLDTTTVILALVGIDFLMNRFRDTVPNAFRLVKPLRVRPFGQPLPLQVTVTVDPSGVFFTSSEVNLVLLRVADVNRKATVTMSRSG
jgi:hypothetical protein